MNPRDIREVKGAGAAGGICGGLYSVYGGEIKSGFDILCEASSLEKKIKESDIVITEAGFGADLGAEKFMDIKCRMEIGRAHV